VHGSVPKTLRLSSKYKILTYLTLRLGILDACNDLAAHDNRIIQADDKAGNMHV